jgi:hypothetical protein
MPFIKVFTTTVYCALNTPHAVVTLPQDLKKAKGHVWGVVFGFFSIIFVTPALGAVMRAIPLEPRLFSFGKCNHGPVV